MDATSTTTAAAPVVRRGPVTARERSLAPDLARGMMLLLIALANTPFYLWTREHGIVLTHPVDGSPAELVVQTVMVLAVDLRTYPMFAFLFGYGIVQLQQRQLAAGNDRAGVRRILRRRNWWLLAFGLVHAVLLWEGDILGIYGLVGLVLCWLLLWRRERTQRVWLGVLAVLVVLGLVAAVGGALALADVPAETVQGDFSAGGSIGTGGYLASIVPRLEVWVSLLVIQGVVSVVVPLMVLLAFVAARHRVLEEPGRHLRLLRLTAAIGIPVGWVGGLPVLLDHLRVVDVPDHLAWGLFPVQTSTGAFAGAGYVALFALLAHHLQSRPRGPGRLARALAALGERSLSGYLAQSVVCAPLLAAWGLGLGRHLSSWSMALLAAGVWALTVVGAAALAARGRRGPAEVALRRLTYGRATTPATASPAVADVDHQTRPVTGAVQREDPER